MEDRTDRKTPIITEQLDGLMKRVLSTKEFAFRISRKIDLLQDDEIKEIPKCDEQLKERSLSTVQEKLDKLEQELSYAERSLSNSCQKFDTLL